jgi:hypothetical protein
MTLIGAVKESMKDSGFHGTDTTTSETSASGLSWPLQMAAVLIPDVLANPSVSTVHLV